MPKDRTEEVLALAGWYPGRAVAPLVAIWEESLRSNGGFEMHDAARSFLMEFGGLAWPQRTPGEHLPAFAFNLNPEVAAYEDDRFDAATAVVGNPLYPLGEVINGHGFLAVAKDGGLFLVMDDVESLGSDPWAAFEQLLR